MDQVKEYKIIIRIRDETNEIGIGICRDEKDLDNEREGSRFLKAIELLKSREINRMQKLKLNEMVEEIDDKI